LNLDVIDADVKLWDIRWGFHCVHNTVVVCCDKPCENHQKRTI